MTIVQQIILKKFIDDNVFFGFRPKLSIKDCDDTTLGMPNVIITVSDSDNTVLPIKYKITYTYVNKNIPDTYQLYIYNYDYTRICL